MAAEQGVLLADRLLHFQDKLCLVPDVRGMPEDLRPGGDIFPIGNRGAGACAALDQNLVASACEFVGSRWGEGNAVFVVLDLTRHTNAHGPLPVLSADLAAGRNHG